MAYVNDQMSDLGKAINTFNINRNVPNPFLQNSSRQAPSSQEVPVPANQAPAPPSNSSAEK